MQISPMAHYMHHTNWSFGSGGYKLFIKQGPGCLFWLSKPDRIVISRLCHKKMYHMRFDFVLVRFQRKIDLDILLQFTKSNFFYM